MDWSLRAKHSSVSGPSPYTNTNSYMPHLRHAYAVDRAESAPPPPEGLTSRYTSQHPLYAADWVVQGSIDMVALGTFREGLHNRIQIVQGGIGGSRDLLTTGDDNDSPTSRLSGSESLESLAASENAASSDFNFERVAEVTVDYPVTHLQWDPQTAAGGEARVAAASEVLRLYRIDSRAENPDMAMVQTHVLANHLAGADLDISTFPPVTSFDWNPVDPSVVITLSVDTTCTVWDLGRSHSWRDHDTAHVKTQLIAHDLEVFDVKFVHGSTDVFASVSNDGSMRVFDLRLLEHLTIIYEPALQIPAHNGHYNPQALLRLLASHVDQHHLATVGVNLNQVLVIDMRMPGVPVVTLDGLFGGISSAAINHISWHPQKNSLLTGGDDCQALVWDCISLEPRSDTTVEDTPQWAYLEEMEVNHVCWRSTGDWMGVVSGKSFQGVPLA